MIKNTFKSTDVHYAHSKEQEHKPVSLEAHVYPRKQLKPCPRLERSGGKRAFFIFRW